MVVLVSQEVSFAVEQVSLFRRGFVVVITISKHVVIIVVIVTVTVLIAVVSIGLVLVWEDESFVCKHA